MAGPEAGPVAGPEAGPEAGPVAGPEADLEARPGVGAVDVLFAALADGTRRTVLRTVVERGPVTATEMAGDLPMSRQAVAKHLRILGDAGLVHAEKVGRETRYEASPEPLRAVSDWIAQTDKAWSHRLGRLEHQVRRAAKASRQP